MKSTLLSAAVALSALALSQTTQAHTLLVDPPPLTSNDGAKSGPCGCEVGGEPPCSADYKTTELKAGQQITVTWKETIQHTGKFRLAFSSKPVTAVSGADLEANILYDKADQNSMAGATLTASITVPSTPCESCTLQLRQLMEGAANPYYYSCASIRIVADDASSSSSSSSSAATGAGGSTSSGEPGSGGAGGAGQGGAPGSGEGGSTGPGLAPPETPIEVGGCSVGGAPAGSASSNALGLFTAAAVVAGAITRLARRRRQR